jgi:hypothetical protein
MTMTLSAEQISTLVVAVVGGVLVVGSYIYLTLSVGSGSYLDSPLWNGIGRDAVIALVFMQALAAIGMIAAICTWVFGDPPRGGLMSRPAALPVTLAVFLVASALWAFLMASKTPAKGAVVFVLVAAAAASIAMLAGSAEESNPRWWVLMGLFFLCATTVLGDAVVWNSRFLTTALPA